VFGEVCAYVKGTGEHSAANAIQIEHDSMWNTWTCPAAAGSVGPARSGALAEPIARGKIEVVSGDSCAGGERWTTATVRKRRPGA
jgi:hypothetical protein